MSADRPIVFNLSKIGESPLIERMVLRGVLPEEWPREQEATATPSYGINGIVMAAIRRL